MALRRVSTAPWVWCLSLLDQGRALNVRAASTLRSKEQARALLAMPGKRPPLVNLPVARVQRGKRHRLENPCALTALPGRTLLRGLRRAQTARRASTVLLPALCRA